MQVEKNAPEIRYFNRVTGQYEVEKVYGDFFIKLLYCSPVGKYLSRLFTSKHFSQMYGAFQDLPASQKKVAPFITKFNIPIDDYEKGSNPTNDINNSYKSFNEFFIRKFRPGKRPFIQDTTKLAAFAEARYVGFEAIDDLTKYPVKGSYLLAKDLIGDEELASVFEGGPLMIARLCPVDYHRYHYPDDGKVLNHYAISGKFDSVNPFALKYKNEIFIENERYVSILETKNFGKIAYIEVGATCVGKIVQSHPWEKDFKRGDEKGYFLFGGSTVVIIGEKGKWKPSEDIIKNTLNGVETYLHLGQEVGVKV